MLALLLTSCVVVSLALAFAWLRRRGEAGGAGISHFLRELEARGVPPELASAAHAELARWLAAPRTPSPGDDLERVYGVAPEERGEAAALLARACGRGAPAAEAARQASTAAELVVCVAQAPPAERASG